MKDIKQFIIEGKAPEKISAAGKKKVTKFVNDCIKHVDDIFDYAGIPTDDCDQVYADCRGTGLMITIFVVYGLKMMILVVSYKVNMID